MLHDSSGKKAEFFCLPVFIVVTLIILVWSLFSLPIIFYHVDILKISQLQGNISDKSIDGSECLNATMSNNSDERCHVEIVNAQTASHCIGEPGQPILFPRNGLELVHKIIHNFELIGASESCLTEAMSFMCLYAYGLCSSSGVNIQPTSSQCVELRDSLCQSEWATAVKHSIDLPNCNEFRELPIKCPEFNSTDLQDTEELNFSGNNQSSPNALLECSEFFYRENSSQVCVPNCYTWNQYGRNPSMVVDGVVIFMAVIGSFASFTILLISYLKPKRMCRFPAIFVVYMAVDILILEILVLVSHMDKRTLHCSSKNLLESLQTVTPFCIITGLSYSYISLQLAVWWFSHTVILFWIVFFPFHWETFKTSGKLKYVHIMCAIFGVLFPLVPIVTSMIVLGVDSRNRADNTRSAAELFLSGGLGYSPTNIPPILCTPSDEDAGFYSLILPICIIQSMGSTTLILSLWRIHMQSVIKKHDSPNSFHFGTAEKKLLLVFIYFDIMLIIVWTAFSISMRCKKESIKSRSEFFTCEQRGHDPDSTCSLPGFLEFLPGTIIVYIIVFLFPVVTLVYAINVQEAKKALCLKRKTYKQGRTAK